MLLVVLGLVCCGLQRLTPDVTLLQASPARLEAATDQNIYLAFAALCQQQAERNREDEIPLRDRVVEIPPAFAQEVIRRGFFDETNLEPRNRDNTGWCYGITNIYSPNLIEGQMRSLRESVQRSKELHAEFEKHQRKGEAIRGSIEELYAQEAKAHLEAATHLASLEVGQDFAVPRAIVRQWADVDMVETGRTSGSIIYHFIEHDVLCYVDRATNRITLIHRGR